MAGLHIIGVGNRFRSDDAFGLVVLDALQQELAGSPRVRLIWSGGDVAELNDAMSDCAEAVLVDALDTSAGAAGTIFRYDLAAEPLVLEHFRSSTHTMGVYEAVELARVLGGLPEKLAVWGVAGRTFEMGEALSAPVAAAVPILSRELADLCRVRACEEDDHA